MSLRAVNLQGMRQVADALERSDTASCVAPKPRGDSAWRNDFSSEIVSISGVKYFSNYLYELSRVYVLEK